MIKINKLIFLISQPRAGSTLIQRILGSHPDVHTTSETWMMLHPLYSMKKTGIETEYSSDLARNSLSDFLNQIDNGPTEYREKMRQMYGSLYERILEPTGKKYFLDKTPRYYLIVKELRELFPESKIIILFRNPLAVAASMIKVKNGDWFLLSNNKVDILSAPDYLLQGIEQLGSAVFSLKYEDVLADPDTEIKKLCDYIGVKFDKKIIEYSNSGLPKWRYGDQETVYKKTKPDIFHADKWIQYLGNHQFWRIMRDYLDYLGEDRINKMGYSFGELDSLLTRNKPKIDIDSHSFGLFKLLDNTRDALLERKQLREQILQKEELIRNKDELIKQRNEELQKKAEEHQQHIKQLLKNTEKMIQAKEQWLKKKDETITWKEQQLQEKESQLKNKDAQLQNKKIQLQEMKNSYSFRIGKTLILPLSVLKKIFSKLR